MSVPAQVNLLSGNCDARDQPNPLLAELNSHRINMLQVNFIQCQRPLLPESRCKPECNFDFELPLVADYAETLARPVAAIAMQQVNLPLDPTLSECDLTV